MYRKSNTQGSLLASDILFSGAIPKNDWSYTYRKEILPLIDEEKFRYLYSEKGGRPNNPIKTSISLLIFMGIEKHSWRGTEFQFARRLDWLNATGTEVGKGKIDHTSLFKFFLKLENNDIARNLFTDLTNAFIDRCGTSLKKQRTDSFFIHGWLQTLSRYQLFKETIRVFLNELNKKDNDYYQKISSNLSKHYLDKKFDLTEKDRDKAKRRIGEMSYDMYYLKQEFQNNLEINCFKSFQTLLTVFSQQCNVEEQEDNEDLVIIKEKIKANLEEEKIISTPHNTEAEYTKKGKQKVTGSKGFVTETCDKNNKTQFITDVNVTGASKADSKELPSMQDRLKKENRTPEEQYVDAGFANGKTILSSEKKDIKLEGPSSGRSQSIEGFAKEDRNLDIADFKVSVDNKSKEITIEECPNKQCPFDQKRSEKTNKINVHFVSEKCSTCPLKKRCPVKIGKTVATFTVDESAYAGSVRHHKYMESEDYRKQCATRAGAESLVNEIANAHGMRKAKHRKTSRINLQMIFSGLGCNTKRFLQHGEKYAYV